MKLPGISRYLFPVAAIALAVLLALVFPCLGGKTLRVTLFGLKEMLLVIPPIFVLLGLLDVWVLRHTMARFMGQDSGLKGSFWRSFSVRRQPVPCTEFSRSGRVHEEGRETEQRVRFPRRLVDHQGSDVPL